jgi:hypothetical protein
MHKRTRWLTKVGGCWQHYMDDRSVTDMPITILRKHVPGQPDVFYGRATLGMTPTAAFAIMEDKGRRLEWDPTWNKDEFRLLHARTEGPLAYDMYHESHAPMLGGFIAAREILCVRVVRRHPDGGITQARAESAESGREECPEAVPMSDGRDGLCA